MYSKNRSSTNVSSFLGSKLTLRVNTWLQERFNPRDTTSRQEKSLWQNWISFPPKGIVNRNSLWPANHTCRTCPSRLGEEIQEVRLKQPSVLAGEGCGVAGTTGAVLSSNSSIWSANFLLQFPLVPEWGRQWRTLAPGSFPEIQTPGKVPVRWALPGALQTKRQRCHLGARGLPPSDAQESEALITSSRSS